MDSKIYSYEILTHRISNKYPRVPSRQELRETILQGNDNYSNTLVIDKNGMFKLIPTNHKTDNNNQHYPVYHETFSAGSRRVGLKAAIDDKYIEIIYKTLLEGWFYHVYSGQTFYMDVSNAIHPENQAMDTLLTNLETSGTF